MKKKFLDLGKQPITNSFLNKIKKKILKKNFFIIYQQDLIEKTTDVKSITKHYDKRSKKCKDWLIFGLSIWNLTTDLLNHLIMIIVI